MARQRNEGDWGETDLDPHEQEESDLNLEDPSAGADEPWSPPDRMPRGSEFLGVETGGGETLDQRINQELPDPGTAYGAADGRAERESARMVGGEDPDAIPADQDVLGGSVDEDASYDGDHDGPEGSAMHVVEEED